MLGHIVNICYKNYFSVDTQATFNFAAILLRAQPFFDLHVEVALAPKNTLMETQLDNGMRVYRDKTTIREISELIAQYSSIWKSAGFV